MRDADFNKLIPEFLANHPKEVLALIPEAQEDEKDQNLGDYVKRLFHQGLWELRLKDLWNVDFTVLVNDPDTATDLDMIPEWCAAYRDRFVMYSSARRKFVTWKLGEVLRDRLTTTGGVTVRRDLQEDVIHSVLAAERAPIGEDLKRLLDHLSDSDCTLKGLEGLWTFQELDGNPIRFNQEELYLVPGPEEAKGIHDSLRRLNLDFENVRWVEPDIGLPAVKRPWVANLQKADANAALELLRRVGSANLHDHFSAHHRLTPVIDFLCSQDPSWLPRDLRLAFLVKTAANQHILRQSGAIFLRSEHPTEAEQILWDGFLRGAFAEVDPAFSPNLRRLLKHAPGLQESLSVPGCHLDLVKTSTVLELLHESRLEHPECITLIEQALTKRLQLHKDAAHRRVAYQAAKMLVEEADRLWESFNFDQKLTVLGLPIHRTADGDLMAVLSFETTDLTTVAGRFWLQSDEDLHDAPIKLPDRQILHSQDASLNRFYRDRLGIHPKNRTELLRACLRQIGLNGVNSSALLKYIAECWGTTVDKLEKDGSRNALEEAQELKTLLGESKSVPCVDNIWRRALDCKSGWSLTRDLRGQGWTAAEAKELSVKIAYPQPIATLDPNLAMLVRQIHNIDEISSKDLALLAATSESSTLTLRERAKLINDNRRSTSFKPLRTPKVLEEGRCPSVGGEIEFRSLVLLPSGRITFDSGLVDHPLPHAADLVALGKVWGLDQQSVQNVLIYLNVPVLTMSDVIQAAVQATTAVPTLRRQAAWEALMRWLGKVTESEGAQVVEALRDQPWVLARKGPSLEFSKPSDVLYRAEAGEILNKQFWVIAGSLPAPLANFRNKLGFLDLSSNPQTVEELALCLSQSHSASGAASIDVYRLVARLIRNPDPNVKSTWLQAANSSPVYRLFRSPEVWIAGERLYAGTDELRRDFGHQLYCASVLKELDLEILQLYRDLGVPDTPTLAQTLAAISRIASGQPSIRATHDGLISLLQSRLKSLPDDTLSVEQASSLRVLTQSGDYTALSGCYRYSQVTKADQLDDPSRSLIIDEQDPSTKKLLNLLEQYAPGAAMALIDVATADLVELDEVSPSESSLIILAPWEQWLAELAEKDSEVHTRLKQYFTVECAPNLSLHVVSRLSVKYMLPNGTTVTQSSKWKGPTSFGDALLRIFVRNDSLEQDFIASPKKLDDLDSALAHQVGRLLCAHRWKKSQSSL